MRASRSGRPTGPGQVDPKERAISPSGPEHIARCPLRSGIVSTGLMVQPSKEKEVLTGLSFDLVILN